MLRAFSWHNDADGGAFRVGFNAAVKVVDVHLHLAQVLVGELADLEVDQHIAAQQAVVENQIDEKMVVVKGKALLTGFKQKALAQLQQKMLDLADDGGLQVGLGIPGLFRQAQKLQVTAALSTDPGVG